MNLPMMQRGKWAKMRQYATPAIVGCLGVGLSVLAFLVSRAWITRAEHDEFARSAQERVVQLRHELEEHWHILRSVQAFYDGSQKVERYEFRSFVSTVLESHTDIYAIAWVPRVTDAQRAALERTAASEGFPGFEITHLGEEGLPVPAGRQREYFPILYVGPLDGNEGLLGADWAQDRDRHGALVRARDTGQPVAVRAVRQPGSMGDPQELALLVPVYSKGTWEQTVEDRRSALDGFLVEMFRPDDVMRTTFSQGVPSLVNLRLVSIDDETSGAVLYAGAQGGYRTAAGREQPDVFESDGALHSGAALEIEGMTWTVAGEANPGFGRLSAAWGAALILGGGLLLTGAITAYLISVARSSAQIGWYAQELTLTQTELERRLSDYMIAQKVLRESEDYLQAISDTVPAGIIILDPETHTIVDANQAATRMIGRSRQTMIGRVCHKFVCPAEVGKCPVTDQGEIFDNSERTFLRASGENVACLSTVVPVTLKGKKHLLHCFVDVSAQKQAHYTAQRESAKLSGMISGMDEGIVFADAGNAIVEVNDYFCKFVGKTRDEILGTRIEEFHGGEVLGRVRTLIDGFRVNPDSQPFITQRSIGGVDVILRMQPIYRDGGYDGVLLNVVDVTEIVVARRRAEEATRVKSEFLANMSHEIRTPMTAILGYADLLTDQNLGHSERSEYVDVIRRNGKHLLALINDILDLSKIESGKATVVNGQCDLVGMIAEVASTMRVRALERGTALTAEYPTRLPKAVMTDCARLRQILVNLVGNAVKFSEKGTVRIRTSFVQDWRGHEAAVRFEIIDTGIGISEENMSRLFQPFVQVDSSAAREYGGTGLGLAITSRIVELLGGDISATSEIGVGSIFTVTIPVRNLEGIEMLERPGEAIHRPEATAAKGVSGAVPLDGILVLVAEDGPDNQRLIRTLLSKAGAEVIIVEDGIAAVQAAKDGCFDVILMDLQMPRMDGYEATRALRASGYSRPILALTAHAMLADREKCLAAGCNDHLTKPINVEALLGKVSQWANTPGVAHERRPYRGCRMESIVSKYASDADLVSLIREFVSCLPERTKVMRNDLSSGNFAELERLAHQLKGAGGSYGYPTLTELAGSLEAAASARDGEGAEKILGELENLCEAIAEGMRIRVGSGA
jgi:PAS domain S-box-containing protein